MSRLLPINTSIHPRSGSALSAASDSTYHSFHDIELYEPVVASPPREPVKVGAPVWQGSKNEAFEATPMRRQATADSGYESIPSGPRSRASHDSGRRGSVTSSNLPHNKPRHRPSIRRAARSTPSPHSGRRAGRQLSRNLSQPQPNAYFHFPTLEDDVPDIEPSYPPPPQTTHYWTSDHTRKLEYAAIDAASRGVKGWVMRHIVPDCFVPKENRRLRFDDDTGSVRRYRLELECDDSGQGQKEGGRGKRRMGWLFRR